MVEPYASSHCPFIAFPPRRPPTSSSRAIRACAQPIASSPAGRRSPRRRARPPLAARRIRVCLPEARRARRATAYPRRHRSGRGPPASRTATRGRRRVAHARARLDPLRAVVPPEQIACDAPNPRNRGGIVLSAVCADTADHLGEGLGEQIARNFTVGDPAPEPVQDLRSQLAVQLFQRRDIGTRANEQRVLPVHLGHESFTMLPSAASGRDVTSPGRAAFPRG